MPPRKPARATTNQAAQGADGAIPQPAQPDIRKATNEFVETSSEVDSTMKLGRKRDTSNLASEDTAPPAKRTTRSRSRAERSSERSTSSPGDEAVKDVDESKPGDDEVTDEPTRQPNSPSIATSLSQQSSLHRFFGGGSSSTKSSGPPGKAAQGSSSRTKTEPGNPRGVVSKLVDALDGDNLLVMFVGVNPGIMTAEKGHAYAHPTNHYWRLLHASGLTPRLCAPSETHALVPWLRYGNTNLVARPTKDASTLTKTELDAGVAAIATKARATHAQAVCLVGKGIWEAVERVWRRQGRSVAPFRYGWRPDHERLGAPWRNEKGVTKAAEASDVEWQGSRVFVATTTSALAANMSWEQKLAVWKELGDWVERRRMEESS